MLICELPPVAAAAAVAAASCCRLPSLLLLLHSPLWLGQQNILRHDMIYMKCRLDAHFYYIFVAVSAPNPPSTFPSHASLAGGLCFDFVLRTSTWKRQQLCEARQGLRVRLIIYHFSRFCYNFQVQPTPDNTDKHLTPTTPYFIPLHSGTLSSYRGKPTDHSQLVRN